MSFTFRLSTSNFLAAALWVSLCGCGVQGPPLPPMLEVPLPPELHASQQGTRLILDWTMPRLTTEGQTVRPEKLGSAEVYRLIVAGLRANVPQQEFAAHAQRVASIPRAELGKPALEHSETLPDGQTGNTAVFGVMVKNDHGASAGYSNLVSIPIEPAPAAPVAPTAVLPDPHGIVVKWTAAPGAEAYRVYRAEGAGPMQYKGQVPAQPSPSYSDTDFTFGKEYRYEVRAIATHAGFIAESTSSPQALITPQNVFPPAVPANMAAVLSEGAVELSWEPNTELDLAGYNIYRSDNGGAFHKLNSELLGSPAFKDADVKPGTNYSYAVTSVNQAGNESGRSQPVSIPR